ncbi:MAG: hypothetical protein AAGC46_19615 [Solirubrobacteraceae bacterium]|nr:hypothetical protein [Patulibacter sp.]
MVTAVVITGLPAILIILVILALLLTGAFVLLRGAGRGASKLAHKATEHEHRT